MDGIVSIDNDFARFGSKSYAINKINSVEVRQKQPYGSVLFLICGLISFIAFMSWLKSKETTPIVVAVIFLGLAYWRWTLTKVRNYYLFLMTSSSETQAYVTRDEEQVTSLRDQIENAMTLHSQHGMSRST